MSEINLLLLCKYCGKFYKSPIVLPCGETICMDHVPNLVSRTSQEAATKREIACHFCNFKHEIPLNDKDLVPNKIIEKLTNIEKDKQIKKLSSKQSDAILQNSFDWNICNSAWSN